MRILTWNLFHGRAVPPRPHGLLGEYAAALRGWDWDVALLQEVPPWWPSPLAVATGSAEVDVRMTSRNWWPSVQRAIGSRNPEVLKSNAGGCNVVLVRPGLAVGDRWSTLLRVWPERRFAHGVLLGDVWVVNVHAEQGDRAVRDMRRVRRVLPGGEHGIVILGGDYNCRAPEAAAAVAPLRVVASRHVDHVAVRGFSATGPAEILSSGGLSDHKPMLVSLARE